MLSLDYPDSVRWQHLLVPQPHLVVLWFADVIIRAALPQNRVESLN